MKDFYEAIECEMMSLVDSGLNFSDLTVENKRASAIIWTEAWSGIISFFFSENGIEKNILSIEVR